LRVFICCFLQGWKKERKNWSEGSVPAMGIERVQCGYVSLVNVLSLCFICVVNFLFLMMNVLIWFLCGSRTKPSKLEKRSITVNSTAIFTSHAFIWCELSCIHSFLTGNLIIPVLYSLFFYYHIHLGLYNTIIILCVVVFHLFWGFN